MLTESNKTKLNFRELLTFKNIVSKISVTDDTFANKELIYNIKFSSDGKNNEENFKLTVSYGNNCRIKQIEFKSIDFEDRFILFKIRSKAFFYNGFEIITKSSKTVAYSLILSLFYKIIKISTGHNLKDFVNNAKIDVSFIIDDIITSLSDELLVLNKFSSSSILVESKKHKTLTNIDYLGDEIYQINIMHNVFGLNDTVLGLIFSLNFDKNNDFIDFNEDNSIINIKSLLKTEDLKEKTNKIKQLVLDLFNNHHKFNAL